MVSQGCYDFQEHTGQGNCDQRQVCSRQMRNLAEYLYLLDLLTDSRQDILFQPVELVKASPGTTLDQAHEDPTHAFEIEVSITVEHQHLQSVPCN